MTVLEEEKTLRFESFENSDALRFMNCVIEIVEKEGLKPVRIRVMKDGDIAVQYLMEGKKGDMWLNRKENTVMVTGRSGLYVFEHREEYPELEGDEKYVICGGGFPLYINDELRGAFTVSGLEHTEDHALIVRALRKMKEGE